MHILFLTENFPPETNAAATRVYERACFWVDWGHRVTVVTCAPNFPRGKLFPGYENLWRQSEEMSGIRVVRVKTFITRNEGVVLRTLDFLSFMATGFAAGLRESWPDVIVATSPQFFAAVAGWGLGAARNVPFVFELGDLWPASIVAVGALHEGLSLRMMEKLELYLYRRSECVVALTGAFKENLTARGTSPAKIAVVVNGVDLSRYGPRPRDKGLAEMWGLEGCFVVGYVGTHGMAHALGSVLDAADRMRHVERLRFILVGSGAERTKLMTEARQRRLDNVIFMPPQPKDDIAAVWSLCDVALVHLRNSPVFREVIPSKMFEAMGMGLPLMVASPDGEASRILATDQAGIWVPAEDPDALARATMKLFEDDTLRRAYGERSLAAAPLHTRERQARQMIGVLDLAAQGRGGEVAALQPS
ncbi:MAG: glycosyltransferase family 4 protein [Rhodospirillales bacterium]|jgi:glycosyltransferase involved in cell wall biosynthesis|nr:glycosyltransferase family 4 protein [Rhodospirillales bacterium]